MRKRRNPAIAAENSLRRLQIINQHRMEEIEGVIKVYKDGRVERPQIIPHVTCALPPESSITSFDVMIDRCTNIWARCYVPKCDNRNSNSNNNNNTKVPLMVYFHGGGFCVGSPSWSCYHEFLAKLAGRTKCAIVSVNYRLAPENVLPAAYDDGVKAIMWLLRQHGRTEKEYHWSNKCDLSCIFLCGDSAGANIVHNVTLRLLCPKREHNFKPLVTSPLAIKGTILIQPFFGGESRTRSETCMAHQPHSLLTLAASDTYWRLALPAGANRDHPWCNPIAANGRAIDGMKDSRDPPSLVFVSELDILRDRSLEYCGALSKAGKKVKVFVSKGVGHAFHILGQSQLVQTRTDELIDQIRAFTTKVLSS